MSSQVCIVATAKNEGPFLIEWIAHHLALGFDKIFIATNDCHDGTVELISAIARGYPVIKIDNNQRPQRHSIQMNAVTKCLAHPDMSDQTWALHIDLDEFLDLTGEAQDVHSFIADFEDADSVSVCWKTFGDSDKAHWDGGSILDGFVRSAEHPTQASGIKNFFRVGTFLSSAPHCPKRPTKPASDVRAVTTLGTVLATEPFSVGWMTSYRLTDQDFTWEKACINHYMHKSHDLCAVTRHFRGDANGRDQAVFKRTVGHRRYNAFNRNDVVDLSIQRYRDRRIAIMDDIRALPDVQALHDAAVQWFFDRIEALRTGDA